MGVGNSPGETDRVATVEALKEKETEIRTKSPQREDVINKPEPKVRLGSSEFQDSSSRDLM